MCFIQLIADKVTFIDYEYGAYNYVAFDIGGHFNEFAGKSCFGKLSSLINFEQILSKAVFHAFLVCWRRCGNR